jgi:zinc protease
MLRFELPNGMRVVIDPAGRSDAAAVYVWINVGSADEPAGMEGAAHFVEHMVFKGTRSYGVGGVASAIEAMGGDLNAWTSFDETVFHATVPAGAAPAAMAVIAEMLREATFDPAELERERAVVVEEIRGSEDDPDSVLSEATYASLFAGHPYARPIIGTARSVATMPAASLRAFYEANYQPSNACLVVVGPVDVAAVRAAADQSFGGGGRVAARAGRPAPAPRRRARTLRRGFEASLVDLAWPAPGVGHPDVAALDVATMALGGGSSSPLEARLRLREGLCLSASAGFQLERDAGSVVLTLHARDGRVAEAVRAAREEVAHASGAGLGTDEIERARAQILAERVFGRETVDGRAQSIAWHMERKGDPEAWRAYDHEIARVDAGAVRSAAARWLAPGGDTLVALLPDRERPRFARNRRRKAMPWDAPPALPAPDLPRRQRRAAPAPSRHVLANGLRVLLLPDDGEVAAIRIAGLGGAFLEDSERAGRGAAWSRAVVRGAGSRDAVAFATAVERLAGTVTAAGGRSSLAVRGEFTGDTFEEGLPLLAEMLTHPRFDRSEVARALGELREALLERADHPDHTLLEAVWAGAYGPHPYGLPVLGDLAGLRRHQGRALRAHHAAWARGGNLVAAVAGAFDPGRVLEILARTLGQLPAGDAVALPPAPVLPTEPLRIELPLAREQVHIAHAFPGIAVRDPRQPAVELLAAVLGGQGGRLFLELREAHGLAYSVSASSQEGLQQGLFLCGLATDPERADEAEARLGESLDRARTAGLDTEEIERARRYLLGVTEIDLQTANARSNLAAYTELYGGDGLRYRSEVSERIQAVSADAVREEATRLLARPVVRARLLQGERA